MVIIIIILGIPLQLIHQFQDEAFTNISNIINYKKFPRNIFAIALNLFHYYTYYKSFRYIDRAELSLTCVFLAHKIKIGFIRPENINDLYPMLKNSNINIIKEKDTIINFQNNDREKGSKNSNTGANKNNTSNTISTSSTNNTGNFNNNYNIFNNNNNKNSGNILEVEMEILNFLGFDLEIENPYNYVILYKKKFKFNENIEYLSLNIITDAFRRPLCIYFHPGTIAFVAIFLAIVVYYEKDRDNNDFNLKLLLNKESRVIKEEFEHCFDCLYNLFESKIFK